MKEEMRTPLRVLNARGEITFATGASETLSEILLATVEEGADGALLPGAVLSARYTLVLPNDLGQWREDGVLRKGRPLIGATVQLFLNDLEMGVFIVDTVRQQEHDGRITLSGSDSVSSELGGTFSDALSYPCTLKEIWLNWLGQTRYTWSGDVPNGDGIVDFPPNWGNATLRSAAGWIAQAAGCFVRVNRLGRLELVKCVGDSIGTISADDYFSLSDGSDAFGPVCAVCIVPYGAENAQRFGDSTGDAIQIEGNPLFQENAEHLNVLAEGLANTLSGLSFSRMTLLWRGDPTLQIGDRIQVNDTFSTVHECVISRQTLHLENGFSSTVECEIPQTESSGVPRAITPEGGVNADRLVGTVDGGLLRVGTVVTKALAARSVTAEKLAAGSVHADAIQAGAVTAEKIAADALTAEEIRAITAHLEKVVAEEIQSDSLFAALIRAEAMAIGKITAGDIQIDSLGAALANFVSLYAKVGEFDLATVENLLAKALILKEGIADSMMIANLAVTSANLLNATVDKLVIKDATGKYYRVFIAADGTISAEETAPGQTEIEAGETADGKQIAETTAVVTDLTTIKASQAILGTIFTEALTAGKITANEALISSASIPMLYVTSLSALGNSIDISANTAITSTVTSVEAVCEAVENVTGRTENLMNAVDSLQTFAENAQTLADAAKQNTQTLQTQITQTNDAVSVIRSSTSALDGRVAVIESGVHIKGAEIGIYSSDSPYRNTITHDGWRITENGAPVITCAETKLTAPRISVTDALIIGGLAFKPGADKHVRLLKYGR